jgi:predicted membrane protein
MKMKKLLAYLILIIAVSLFVAIGALQLINDPIVFLIGLVVGVAGVGLLRAVVWAFTTLND